MNCVRCKTGLVRKNYEGVEIDQCPKCRGIWLDDGELQQIIAREEEHFSPEMIRDTLSHSFAGIPEAEEQSVELCPKCDARMTAINYAYLSGVIIDRCPNQHGVWLDADEIDKIQINQEHWKHEVAERKGAFVKTMRSVEASNHVAVEEMKNRASHVPSNYLANRIVGAVMKIFDND